MQRPRQIRTKTHSNDFEIAIFSALAKHTKTNMSSTIVIVIILVLLLISSYCTTSLQQRSIALSIISSAPSIFTSTIDTSDLMFTDKLWNGVIARSVADEGFTDLQSVYAGGDRLKKGVKEKPKMTRKDRQLDSAKLLYTTNARLDEVVKLFERSENNV